MYELYVFYTTNPPGPIKFTNKHSERNDLGLTFK